MLIRDVNKSMSELFKALQRLEEKNSPDMPIPPPASGGVGRGSRSFPYLKSLILIGAAFVIAAVFLFFTWLGPDWLLSLSQVQGRGDSLQSTEVSRKQAIVTPPDDIVVETPMQPTPGKEGMQKERDQIIRKEVEKIARLQEKTDPDDMNGSGAAVEEEGLIRKNENHDLDNAVKIEQDIGVAGEYIRSEDVLEFQRKQKEASRKRLLYRAESERIQGDSSAALLLYQQAWEMGPDPGLANNIAAVLIGFQEYSQAEIYLLEALKLAPGDKDLLFNLEIVNQGKQQNK